MSLERPEYEEVKTADLHFAIVAARYNKRLVDALCESVNKTLLSAGVLAENIDLVRVPGSNELPYIAAMHAASEGFDCIIALGVVIAGETDHHQIIGSSTAGAFHTIGIQFEVPVINGVLTVEDVRQAEDRASGDINRGEEFAKAAIEMARHKVDLAEVLDNVSLQSLTEIE